MSGTSWFSSIACNMQVGLVQRNGQVGGNGDQIKCMRSYFEMPLHYPRYKKADYETMPEWQLNCLLKQYGLPVTGDVADKRKFAMGAFLWPSQMKD